MPEKLGVVSILAVLSALQDLGSFGVKITADGKVNLADLPALIELAKKSGEIGDAVKSFGNIDEEIKDLSQEELVQIVAKVYEVISTIKSAKQA